MKPKENQKKISDTLHNIVRDPGIYLGMMPVLYTSPGETLKINLTRFMDVDDHTQITSPDLREFPVALNHEQRTLELDIPDNQLGLVNIPIQVHTAGKEGEAQNIYYLTIVIIPESRHPFTYCPQKQADTPRLIPEKKTNEEIVFRVASSKKEISLRKISALIQEPDGSNWKPRVRHKKEFIKVDIKGAPKGSYLRILVSDAQNRVSSPQRIPVRQADEFAWHDAVIYSVMLDRFRNGNPENDSPTKHPDILYQGEYHGGDLEGMLQKIEDGYFTRLGINTLWLSPLYQNPDEAYQECIPPYRYFSGYHGYWPIDMKKVDRRLGDMKLLKKVVEAAHKKGLRILLDMVFNHTHIENPLWKEHPDWYGSLKLPDGRENLRLWDECSFTTWFDRFIPSFNYDNPEVSRAMVENARWWLEETGADGFRLDAVKHIPGHFWSNLRKYLRQTVEIKRGRHLYMIGEAFLSRQGIMEFVGPNTLDGQFDFPLYDVIVPTFARDDSEFENLNAALEASERIYGKETIRSTLVGNHDKARFMAYANGALPDADINDEREVGYANPPQVNQDTSYAKLKNAFAFIFTIDGAPMVYYGDEIGMTGAGDPDNRRDMRFGDELTDQEKEMLDFTGRLSHIRNDHPALRHGSRHTVLLEQDVYAYARAYFSDRLLVVFNKSDRDKQVRFCVAPDLPAGIYRDLLSGQKREVDKKGFLELTIPARSSMIFSHR